MRVSFVTFAMTLRFQGHHEVKKHTFSTTFLLSPPTPYHTSITAIPARQIHKSHIGQTFLWRPGTLSYRPHFTFTVKLTFSTSDSSIMGDDYVAPEFAEEMNAGASYNDTFDFEGFAWDVADPSFDPVQFVREIGVTAEEASDRGIPEHGSIETNTANLTDAKDVPEGQRDEEKVPDAILVKEASGSRQSPARLPDEEHRAQSDPQASVEDHGERSRHPDTTRGNDSNSHDQQQINIPIENHQHELERNDFVQDEGELPLPPNINPRNDASNFGLHQLQQADSTSGNGQSLHYFNHLDANDQFGNGQADAGFANDQPPLEDQLNVSEWPEWKEFVRDVANKEFATSLGLQEEPYVGPQQEQSAGVQEEQHGDHRQEQSTGREHSAQEYGIPADDSRHPYENFGNRSHHARAPVRTQHLSAVNTPDETSAHDTTTINGEAIHDQIHAIPDQVDDAVQYPSPGDMPGPSSTTNPATIPLTHSNNETTADARHDQSPRVFEEGYDPELPVVDTYSEDDPLIIEDESQNGYGRTGRIDGQEMWYNEEESHWQPSASHHDMRAVLIAKAQAQFPNDRYLHPDPTHGIPHGETAFFKPHQNRGPARSQCADELFAWREYEPKKNEEGKYIRKTKAEDKREHPEYMYLGGKILLDPHNNPVVDHKFIPLTLSVYTDPGKLQEMALHRGCRQVDCKLSLKRFRYVHS